MVKNSLATKQQSSWIAKLWQFKGCEVEKIDPEDRIAFFKAGLWRLDALKNGTIFSRNQWWVVW